MYAGESSDFSVSADSSGNIQKLAVGIGLLIAQIVVDDVDGVELLQRPLDRKSVV